MKKKIVKPKLAKALKMQLLAAVQKVLAENRSVLTDRVQKVVNKSIKKIVRETDKEVKKLLATK